MGKCAYQRLLGPADVNVLIVCEFSGIMRDAFRERGFNAWSCDRLPTESDPRWHLQMDALDAIRGGTYPRCKSDLHLGYVTKSGSHSFQTQTLWHLLIAHTPCTFLANSGAKHLYKGARKENGPDPKRWENMRQDAQFYVDVLGSDVEFVAAENPVMHGPAREEIERLWAARHREPLPEVSYVEPHEHGHGETKKTGFRLRRLPPLKPSRNVAGREQRIWKMPPSPDRWKDRSRTFPGIAAAAAEQWGNYVLQALNPTRTDAVADYLAVV